MASSTIGSFFPTRLILFGFLCIVMMGTVGLALPFARTVDIPLLDLFFIAVSAATGTGLLTVPMESFTTLGHFILLLLIQIGGLGLITLTIFLLSLFFNLGLAATVMAAHSLELESMKNVRQFLFFIVWSSLFFELVGACAIFWAIKDQYTFGYSIFVAAFHAISSFCNAGFTLFEGSMEQYSGNYLMLTITSILMLLGGLGCLTWRDILHRIKALINHKRSKVSLQSKLIVYISVFLIVFCSIILFCLEENHGFAAMPFLTKIMNTLFHAISFRSAGFITVPLRLFQPATMLLIIVAAFIGTAPGSTGSGIRVTTVGIFWAVMRAALLGKHTVNIMGRRIMIDQVYKAIAIMILSVMWLLTTTFFLVLAEKNISFFDIAFESFSAFTTLGLSMGITAALSPLAKALLMLNMVVGKIGSLTFIFALRKRKPDAVEILYPEERVMLS